MDRSQSKKDSPSSQRKLDPHPHAHTPLKSNDANIQYGGTSTVDDDDDVPLLDAGDDKTETTFSRVYGIVTTLTIEPVMFLFMFAFVMNLSVLTNMMMDKGCLYYFNYTKEVCGNLSSYETEKDNVEVLANNYSLYASLTSLIAAFMMTFIAPWSDKYGRRIPLLVSVIGALLTDIGLLLSTLYFESELWYIVLARIPSECAGGFICMLTTIFSHASEVSTEKNRTLKYTAIEIALGLGVSFGGLTGGFLYRYYGYFYVYVTVASAHLFCFVWVLFVVEETTGLNVRMKWHEKARDFFNSTNLKAGISATCKPREGNIRAILILLLFSMCAIILNYEALGSINYVYVHHVYSWDPTIYSIVNTASFFSGIVTTLISVPIFIRFFKLRDFTMGVIGSISMIAKSVVLAFSKNHTYIYYIGLSLGIFTPLSSLAVRAGISKLVEKEELGRVFSFVATCEAVIPMLGTIVVTKLYNATMDSFPNVTYSFGASLLLLPLATFIWALRSTKSIYSELNVSVNSDNKEKV